MGNYTGRRPRMILLDRPEKIVEAVVWAARHPERQEIAVGWKAKGAIAAERLAPRAAERFAGGVFEGVMRQAPSGTPIGPGDVYTPDTRRDPARTGVEGGVRERMKAEDAAKSAVPAPRDGRPL